MKILLFLALLPSPARALFCESGVKLEEKLELCDDNEKFAQAAESCKISFVAEVKAEQARLGLALGKDAAPGTQNASQELTAASYDATLARLDALIVRGLGSRIETLAYLPRFLPPFHWNVALLGPMPAQGDPALAKAYDGEYCFGEHRETIEHMVQDFDKALTDLRAARKKAVALKAAAAERTAGFGGAALAASGHAVGSGVERKPSAAGASDITGVEQDREKRK